MVAWKPLPCKLGLVKELAAGLLSMKLFTYNTIADFVHTLETMRFYGGCYTAKDIFHYSSFIIFCHYLRIIIIALTAVGVVQQTCKNII